MNKDLEETNQRLQVTQASLIVAEKNATMVNMAKAIGHEVNNPLSVVRLRVEKTIRALTKKHSELLDQPSNADISKDDFRKYLENLLTDQKKAITAANRIDGVVQTLTSILRESTGEMKPLSLVLLFQEAKEATRFSTYDENLQGCDMVLNISSSAMVLGDLRRLLQVFINLFKNAYEAMEEAHTPDRRIWVNGQIDPDDPNFVRIDVKDNGPGIPPEIMDKIWRQDFSTKKKKSDAIGAAGQGQGLFICKHMIESVHKGSITVESEVGKGTTFIIRLPSAGVEE